MTTTAEREHRQIGMVVEGLREAALDAGVELPPGYAEVVCADGLGLCERLGVTRLGEGVLLHTAPETADQLPRLLGYADLSGQWFRDGTKFVPEGAGRDQCRRPRGGIVMATQSQLLAPLPEHLNVVAWRDLRIEATGHGPDRPYIEATLGVLGPSTTLAWRRLARLATARPGTVVGTAELAQSLGLSQGLERNAPISRTVRMESFGAASRSGTTLAVRTALPDVAPGQRQRLSVPAQLAHGLLGQRQPSAGSAGPGPVGGGVGL